jgi:KDO2-lipid IV(A) lauroyltransferase
MTLVGRLVAKTGARVVYAFAERLPRGQGFRMTLLEETGALEDLDVKGVTQAINHGIEHCVRLIPDQYQWTYKRFRPDVIDVADAQ